MKKSIKAILLSAAAMLLAVSAFAQVTTANIAGKVADKNGAVEGAVVIAVHTPTGTQYYSVADKNGQYRINSVIPGGPYSVKAESLGYRSSEVDGFYTAIGETGVIDFVLEDESLSLDAVVVSADASDSGMNIRRSGVGTTVSQRTMENLPTSTSRSLNDILKLTPQATTSGNGFAAGGGNYRSSYITVDGAAFNNAFGIGANLPAGGTPISLDALEQMSISLTPFDVRQSGFTGAAVNAVTKSGTNEFKVAVYDYYTSDKVMGRKYYNTVDGKVAELAPTQKLSNTIGANVGGPIIKNKLFFFVNFEYEPQSAPATTLLTDNGTWTAAGGTAYRRPTKTRMEEIKNYLGETYGYNPGRYENYSVDVPTMKLMARVDWNINPNNKFNVRYSMVKRKSVKTASTSISPINDVGYDRNSQGRGSNYALPFESANYFQEENFYSIAGELNSRLFDGKLNNTLRATWSHQYEPRSFYGDLFPTVDIMEEGSVYTTIGPDPFTYGNLRDVTTVVVTDEVNWSAGINNFIAGVQYEHNNTKNGFMQGGAGWYTYASWEDFKNNATPVSFMITHANRDDLQQVYPQFDYNQLSAYFQDELNISDNFKLTAGLRLEMPFYPTIEGNENKAFTQMYASHGGYKTSDMPTARLNVSPRIGFNWDILGDRSIILRGGTGIYTGRIPFVWIVSVAGNSNCLQNQIIMKATDVAASTDGKVNGVNIPGFHNNINDILKDCYNGQAFKAGDLAAPSQATILDKNLIMPTTWKSSLAADFQLPGGIKGTLEGIFSKDLYDVRVIKTGLTESTIQFPGEPKTRTFSKGISGLNNAYLITNDGVSKGLKGIFASTKEVAHYGSITASLKKDFNFGLSLNAAYTYSVSKSFNTGDGDQTTSCFSEQTYCVNGSNSPELGNSAFVSPHRLIANASYRIEYGKFATNLGIFYEGYNFGYIDKYAYSRLSYTMSDGKNNLTGEGGAHNLIYIPTKAELDNMPFAANGNKAEYEKFIAADKYLSSHRGQYAERGAVAMPWYSQIGVRASEDFNFKIGQRTHTIRLGVDINNFANLLNPKWGNVQQIKTNTILTYKNGEYSFDPTAAKFNTYANYLSTWSMLFSARYFF